MQVKVADKQKTGSGVNSRQTRRKKILEYFNREDESQEEKTNYTVGSRVYHETFGKGEVIKVEGNGDNAKISIKFEGNLLKKLIAQYANLSPIEISD
jgi:DNA helicase-2/ATP-dependent DNA helicase PcrA